MTIEHNFCKISKIKFESGFSIPSFVSRLASLAFAQVTGRNVINLVTSFDPVLSAKAQQVKKIGRKMLKNRKFAVSDSLLETARYFA
jgi:hypothetical protein